MYSTVDSAVKMVVANKVDKACPGAARCGVALAELPTGVIYERLMSR